MLFYVLFHDEVFLVILRQFLTCVIHRQNFNLKFHLLFFVSFLVFIFPFDFLSVPTKEFLCSSLIACHFVLVSSYDQPCAHSTISAMFVYYFVSKNKRILFICEQLGKYLYISCPVWKHHRLAEVLNLKVSARQIKNHLFSSFMNIKWIFFRSPFECTCTSNRLMLMMPDILWLIYCFAWFRNRGMIVLRCKAHDCMF